MRLHFFRWFYTFSLYDNYFETVKQINSGNGSSRKQVLHIQAFLFSFTLFLVTVALVSDQLPTLAQLALNNWFFFEDIPMGHLVWVVTVIYLLMYMNILLYLRNDGVTFEVLYSIIASKDAHDEMDQFFIQSQVRFFQRDISLVQLFCRRLLPLGRLIVRANNLNASNAPEFFSNRWTIFVGLLNRSLIFSTFFTYLL